MSSFEISDFELQNAKKLNVEIIPSTVKDKKLDVIRDGKYLFSIGNLLIPSYSDWKKSDGEIYAEQRKKLYWMKNLKNVPQDGLQFYSSHILWGFK